MCSVAGGGLIFIKILACLETAGISGAPIFCRICVRRFFFALLDSQIGVRRDKRTHFINGRRRTQKMSLFLGLS